MIDKGPDRSYKHSHKKITKSFAKALDIKYRIGQNSQPRSLAASQPRSLAASQPKGSSCPNQIKYKLLNPRPKTDCRSKTAFSSLGFFYVFRIGTIQSEKTFNFEKMGFLGAKPISRTFLFSGL